MEGPCEHGDEPSFYIKYSEVLEYLYHCSFSRRAQLHKEGKQVKKIL
jgi:hypothetical protein